MKSSNINNSNVTYFSGWHTALYNYDVFEVESIYQLVNHADDIPPVSIKSAKLKKNYLTRNFDE